MNGKVQQTEIAPPNCCLIFLSLKELLGREMNDTSAENDSQLTMFVAGGS